VGRVAIALISVTLATGACSGSADDFVGPWTDGSGSAVPADNDHGFTVASYRGAEHCGWESTIFLEVTWPPGSVIDDVVYDDSASTPRVFLRDPTGLFADMTRGGFVRDAVLPADAKSTSLLRGRWELWTARSVEGAVFLVSDDRVERWPEASQVPGCI
jgi:hypothetical protein